MRSNNTKSVNWKSLKNLNQNTKKEINYKKWSPSNNIKYSNCKKCRFQKNFNKKSVQNYKHPLMPLYLRSYMISYSNTIIFLISKTIKEITMSQLKVYYTKQKNVSICSLKIYQHNQAETIKMKKCSISKTNWLMYFNNSKMRNKNLKIYLMPQMQKNNIVPKLTNKEIQPNNLINNIKHKSNN